MILRPRILRILLRWGALGLISNCLVIYYQRINSLRSGILIVLCNRVGDIGLLIFIRLSSSVESSKIILYIY